MNLLQITESITYILNYILKTFIIFRIHHTLNTLKYRNDIYLRIFVHNLQKNATQPSRVVVAYKMWIARITDVFNKKVWN